MRTHTSNVFVLLNEVACSSCVVACQKEPPPPPWASDDPELCTPYEYSMVRLGKAGVVQMSLGNYK